MILSFDACEIDTTRLEVRVAGAPVAVQPKVFDLLVLLASDPGRVVSKEELIDKLWMGRIVSDAALSTCMKAARHAIGDDGKQQRVIRTVQKKGFRFVGNVSVVRQTASIDSIALSNAATDQSGRTQRAEPPDVALDVRLPEQPSIAVLPFETLQSDESRFALANGLTRDITTRLGRARWLFVIARGSSFRFRSGDALKAASMLGVRYVLHGSVQPSDRRARVNVTLIDAVERAEVWADLFDFGLEDIFAVQDAISEAIIGRVQSEIEQTERRRALLRPLASLDAWGAYHRACWHLDRHTPEDYEQAEACFKRAAALDPRSARVFAGLSAVHRQRAFLQLARDRDGESRRALELAQHSLSLDPADPQAHWAAGRAQMLRYEVRPALEAFETASSLNPSFAMSQYSVGFGRTMIGDADLSDMALARARRLSPLDPMRFAMLATHAFNAAAAGEHGRAADLAQLAASQPNAHHHIVAVAALCSMLAGRRPEAERYVNRLRTLQPGYTSEDYFRAFPFQADAHAAMWRRSFNSLGLR